MDVELNCQKGVEMSRFHVSNVHMKKTLSTTRQLLYQPWLLGLSRFSFVSSIGKLHKHRADKYSLYRHMN